MADTFGKYLAEVVDVEDPEKSGRVKVDCPDIYAGNISDWLTATHQGQYFSVPKLKDLVWLTFEEGQEGSPVISGKVTNQEECFEQNNAYYESKDMEYGCIIEREKDFGKVLDIKKEYVNIDEDLKVEIGKEVGIKVGEDLKAEIGKEVEIKVGGATIKITPAGDITIEGKNVKISGEVKIDGNVKVEGNIGASGSITPNV